MSTAIQGGLHRDTKGSKLVRYSLIGISLLFVFLMLILPLITVITEAFKQGFAVYSKAVSDDYTIKAILLTLEASFFAVAINTVFGLCAAWSLTKFKFKGKKILATLIDLPVTVSPIIAGLIFLLTFGRQSPIFPLLQDADIKIVFAVPGIVLATIFVTFPFISRELIPVLTAQGVDEEEAAALMGARTWTIFRKVTLPHVKWALLYGVVLCTARAMGEFGAVSVLSGHLRGKTNTLPLYIELLYQGYDFTGAFAASSILVVLTIVVLVLRVWLEGRGNKDLDILK